MPCQWDFPHIRPSEWCLPEAKVGTWGGFVFINPDQQAESLDDFIGPELTDQFRRWPLERRYKQAHVAKILRCNWKVAQEAFMEAFHVVATHPQLLPGIGDANSQYDVWGNFSRAITANGTPSPHLSWKPTEQEMFDAMVDRRLDEPPLAEIGGGLTARVGGGERRARDAARRRSVRKSMNSPMPNSSTASTIPSSRIFIRGARTIGSFIGSGPMGPT